MPYIRIVLEAEVEHLSGSFESTDSLAAAITDLMDDPGEIEGENGGTYSISSWDVNPDWQGMEDMKEQLKKARRARRAQRKKEMKNA